MRIEKQHVQLVVDGKPEEDVWLNRGYQRAVFYIEHGDINAELAQGKTKQQARAEELQRLIYTLINEAMRHIEELDRLSPAGEDAADEIISELYETFSALTEAMPSKGGKLKALERRAANLFFAWRDAEYSVMKRDYDEAAILSAICFDMDNKQINEEIPKNQRTREALRKLEEIKTQAEEETRRELSPEGRELYNRFAALDEARLALADDQEEAEKSIEAAEAEAEAALDALALEDPEEATRIYRRCPYFECAEGLEKYEVYLGAGVFCRRDELLTLDTPEKRAAKVKAAHEDEDGAGDLPSAISGGEAVKLDGGEPVKLEGFAGPFKLG